MSPLPNAYPWVLSAEEAAELIEYMQHQYLNPNKHPALHRLMERLMVKARKTEGSV